MIGYAEGPWMVGPVDDCTVTRIDKDGGRHIVAEIDGDYNQPDTWLIMEANARLIAAAPEMYEALTACQKALALVVSPDAIQQSTALNAFAQCTAAEANARAVLSKAGGGNG